MRKLERSVAEAEDSLEKGDLDEDIWRMSATTIDDKRRTTLPEAVVKAAGIKANDQIEWRVEEGEIRGRKVGDAHVEIEAFPRGSLLPDLTPERDEEQLAILSGCVKGPIESE